VASGLETPVLIVGAGLTGTVLALELARGGVPCTVVDRLAAPSPHPRTYYINSRSMELLRRLGLAEALQCHGVDSDDSTDILWAHRFGTPPVLVWHYPSANQVRRRFAAVNDGTAPVEPYQRVSGVVLEHLVRRRLLADPLIDLREGATLTDLHRLPDDEGVVASVDDRAGPVYTIRARYVAGCDGAMSRVRQLVRIPVDRTGPRCRFRSVHFRSHDPALRPFGTAFTTIVSDGATLVRHGRSGDWTGTIPESHDSRAVDPVARFRDQLDVSFRIDRALGTTRHAATHSVAKRYSEGPVFLVGDAAHQFHPIGGYGESTGIADAVDLGWKLAAALTGWGGSELLGSYERERRPVALFNRELSADLAAVSQRFSRLASAGASREHLAGMLEEDVHRLDDLGVQLGYRYDASPVVCHEQGDAPTWQWRQVTASTWPGTRAPAVRMADGSQLFDSFGPGFTLVDLSERGAGAALAREATRRSVPITYLPLDDPAVRGCWERDLVLVRPDHHVAWRDDTAPDDWGSVLAQVSGHSTGETTALISRRTTPCGSHQT